MRPSPMRGASVGGDDTDITDDTDDTAGVTLGALEQPQNPTKPHEHSMQSLFIREPYEHSMQSLFKRGISFSDDDGSEGVCKREHEYNQKTVLLTDGMRASTVCRASFSDVDGAPQSPVKGVENQLPADIGGVPEERRGENDGGGDESVASAPIRDEMETTKGTVCYAPWILSEITAS